MNMKKLFALALSCLLVAAPPAAMTITLTSCVTQRVAAAKTLKATAIMVDSAMKASADAYVAGKITDQSWQRIAGLHAKFQVIYNKAVDAVAMDLNQATPPEVGELAAQIVEAVQSIR